MKREMDTTQPAHLIEDWQGKYAVFSWLEYVVTVPHPIFLVTTRKTNGGSNANLQSWGLLLGEKGSYFSLLFLLDSSPTCGNFLRELVKVHLRRQDASKSQIFQPIKKR